MGDLRKNAPERTELGSAEQETLTSAKPDVNRRRPRWWARYGTRLIVTDAIAIYIAVFTAYLVRLDIHGNAQISGELSMNYLAAAVILLWSWLTALVLNRSQDRRVVALGPLEFQLVVSASLRVFAGVAVLAYLLKLDIGRGFLAVAFPLGLFLLIVGRLWWRLWLHRSRQRNDEMCTRVLIAGHTAHVARAAREMSRLSSAGFVVIGACVPDAERDITIEGVPTLGNLSEAGQLAIEHEVDALTVVGSDGLTAEAVRRIGWDLEGSGVDLALALGLSDVAGPRVVVQPVQGLPLVYVDPPQFVGGKYVVKTVLDWLGALVFTVLLSPVLAGIAIAIKVTSPGPILYRQERVGVNGQSFTMLKFRSMVPDAHQRLQEVLAAEGADAVGMFYKPKNDPRVTPLGRVLRRYSLDELPQLLNVLRGEMSLVGPRPQIAEEVAQYDRHASRRLLVKPGLTGLWQVSGRSELTPEDGIRMDVDYVENWSPYGDLIILARTVAVVFGGKGAY